MRQATDAQQETNVTITRETLPRARPKRILSLGTLTGHTQKPMHSKREGTAPDPMTEQAERARLGLTRMPKCLEDEIESYTEEEAKFIERPNSSPMLLPAP